MQNKKIFEKAIKNGFKVKKYKNTSLYYQGEYELDFLNNFYEKIPTLQKGSRIKYTIDNIARYYFPDFFIPSKNLIIEIKSKYWNQKHIKINLLKAKACLILGYDYILIEDKKYEEFMKRIQVINE